MQTDGEKFELQNINKDKDINEEKTIVTISEHYCCICINTTDSDFIKLQCCNQSIHETCIIEFIISINNNIYKCPTCRKNLDIPISFGKIIDYINENTELISKEKIQDIINNLYKDIRIKDLFNMDKSAEIEHLKNTIEKLTMQNDRFRVIFLFIYLPLIVMFTVFVFNNYNN